jgi:hypothetical protein
MGTPPACR